MVVVVVARINDAVMNMTCLRQSASKPEYLIPKINRTNIMDFIYQSASGYFSKKIKSGMRLQAEIQTGSLNFQRLFISAIESTFLIGIAIDNVTLHSISEKWYWQIKSWKWGKIWVGLMLFTYSSPYLYFSLHPKR